jgi:hypothetical protein
MNITTRALKITVSELTFETGTSHIRRGWLTPRRESSMEHVVVSFRPEVEVVTYHNK